MRPLRDIFFGEHTGASGETLTGFDSRSIVVGGERYYEDPPYWSGEIRTVPDLVRALWSIAWYGGPSLGQGETGNFSQTELRQKTP